MRSLLSVCVRAHVCSCECVSVLVFDSRARQANSFWMTLIGQLVQNDRWWAPWADRVITEEGKKAICVESQICFALSSMLHTVQSHPRISHSSFWIFFCLCFGLFDLWPGWRGNILVILCCFVWHLVDCLRIWECCHLLSLRINIWKSHRKLIWTRW